MAALANIVNVLYYIDMGTTSFERRLAHTKRNNLGHVLLRSARLFDAQGLAQFREQSGLAWLTSAHLRMMPHIDLEGTRVSEVARRMGITKQAVGQLAQPVIDAGLLAKLADPDDGRARRLSYTDAGQAAILSGLRALARVEALCRRELGSERVTQLVADLRDLLVVLERSSDSE